MVCSKLSSITISDDIDYFLTCSMGISIYPRHGVNFADLYQCADNALYKSKEIVGSCYTIYDSIEIKSESIGNYTNKEVKQLQEDNFFLMVDVDGEEGMNEIKSILHKALLTKEFKVYCQPQISTKSCGDITCEILSRWDSPKYGMIMPNKFIPLFEKTKMMNELDSYMLNSSMAIAEQYIKEKKRIINRFSVNQSISTITSPNYLVNFENIIKEYPTAAKYLVIEITERGLFTSMRTILKVLKAIQSFGVQISLDDFGSGYTTLSVLKDIAFDEIKIDKGLLESSVQNEKRGDIIISQLCSMAKGLRTRTVAEGIETIEQARVLSDMGVDYLQGFYFSRAVPIEEFSERLNNGEYDQFTIDINSRND